MFDKIVVSENGDPYFLYLHIFSDIFFMFAYVIGEPILGPGIAGCAKIFGRSTRPREVKTKIMLDWNGPIPSSVSMEKRPATKTAKANVLRLSCGTVPSPAFAEAGKICEHEYAITFIEYSVTGFVRATAFSNQIAPYPSVRVPTTDRFSFLWWYKSTLALNVFPTNWINIEQKLNYL